MRDIQKSVRHLFVTVVSLVTMVAMPNPLAQANEAYQSVPADFQLSSIIAANPTFPPYDMTVAATDKTLTFTFERVCFPKCAVDIEVPTIKAFLAGLGFTPEQHRGVTTMHVTFARHAMCRQSVAQPVSMLCDSRSGLASDAALSFSKQDGTKLAFDDKVFFLASFASRRTDGFEIPSADKPYVQQATPYMRYDVTLLATRQGFGAATLKWLNLKNNDVVINGVRNP